MSATSFQQAQTTQIVENGFTFGVYLWSTAANWTGGVPGSGAAATVDVTAAGNPSGVDKIATLFLDTLDQAAGQTAVAGDLQIGSLGFGTANFPSVFSDTLLGGSSATLTIDGFSGGNFGSVGAFGTGAITYVQAPTDPGETYQVDDGGELVLSATPNGSSGNPSAGFYYENSVATGTFAFRDPGSTVSDALGGVAIGDAIALPGSDVISVSYGTSSLTVVTNLGTTTFTNVSYQGTRPSGYTVGTDAATGLLRITFAGQQASSFQQAQTTAIVENGFTFDVYLWSTAANWTGGVPGNGAAATVDVAAAGNPSGVDNIATLFLDALDQAAGQTAVAGDLQIGSLGFGTANFPSVFSDTLLGGSSATLTIDGFSGSNFGSVGAFGTGAITYVLAPTDPGETYQVDDGGELVLSATPNGSSGNPSAGLYYENSVATGTFAFRDPGSTVSDALGGVAIGDAIALPGSDVISVSYGTSSLTVVTNLGTTTFTNVSYQGTRPTGYTVGTDAATGLLRITFAGQQATSFQQAQTTAIVENGFTFDVYLWSTAANWTGGVAGSGAAATVDVTAAGNPSGVDNIATLFLDTLDQAAGQTAVAGDLQIGSLGFGTANFPSVFSDTLLGGSSATLTIDGFSGGNFGSVGAFGTGAITYVQAPTDPGETYQVDDGGELVLSAAPNGSSGNPSAGFYFENSVATGTFAFRDPGGTVSDALGGVAIGDAIALPGSDVISVSYGTSSLTVVTNLGTTTFTNVSYQGTRPSGYTVGADAATGLLRITFAGQQASSFQQAQNVADRGERLHLRRLSVEHSGELDGRGAGQRRGGDGGCHGGRQPERRGQHRHPVPRHAGPGGRPDGSGGRPADRQPRLRHRQLPERVQRHAARRQQRDAHHRRVLRQQFRLGRRVRHRRHHLRAGADRPGRDLSGR